MREVNRNWRNKTALSLFCFSPLVLRAFLVQHSVGHGKIRGIFTAHAWNIFEKKRPDATVSENKYFWEREAPVMVGWQVAKHLLVRKAGGHITAE